ncbi:hypothetical protein YC2023_026599 [Brassica napus]
MSTTSQNGLAVLDANMYHVTSTSDVITLMDIGLQNRYVGGQANTLMFVLINHDVISYSESMSTLKFTERVFGVEIGDAKSSKNGKDVRDLMEQLASLKDTIASKDEEIERLHSKLDYFVGTRCQKKNIKKKKQSCKKILGPIKRFDGDVVEYLKVMLLSLVHKSRAGRTCIASA